MHRLFLSILFALIMSFSANAQIASCNTQWPSLSPQVPLTQFQDSWVLLKTQAGTYSQQSGGSIPHRLEVLRSDGTTDCRTDWGRHHIMANDLRFNNFKYVFITPGDYRWLGTLRSYGNSDEKHIVFLYDDEQNDDYTDEIRDYINFRVSKTPVDALYNSNRSVNPNSIKVHPSTHAILENFRLSPANRNVVNSTGNFVIRGLSFSGRSGLMEEILKYPNNFLANPNPNQTHPLVTAVHNAGFSGVHNPCPSGPCDNWSNLSPGVINNFATSPLLSNFYLNGDDCGFSAGLRNNIIGTEIRVSRVLIENVGRGPALSVSSCDNCLVEENVIRNSYSELCTFLDKFYDRNNPPHYFDKGSDKVGIMVSQHSGECEGLRILNNKIYNTTDGIHFLDARGARGTFPDGLVKGNVIYNEQDKYLYLDDQDFLRRGTMPGKLQMIEGEDAIDIKTGGAPGRPLVIEKNRIYGSRGPLGEGGVGYAINCHIKAANVTINANYISDCQNGILLSNYGTPTDGDNLIATNNVIEKLYLGLNSCNHIENSAIHQVPGYPGFHNSTLTGIGIWAGARNNVLVAKNCISGTIIPLFLGAWNVRNGTPSGPGAFDLYVEDNVCVNNTRPMWLMRLINYFNPSAWANFNNNFYEYYDNGGLIHECCEFYKMPGISRLISIRDFGAVTRTNDFSSPGVNSVGSNGNCNLLLINNNVSCKSMTSRAIKNQPSEPSFKKSNLANKLTVYPNPFSHKFNIKIAKGTKKLLVRDLNGRILYSNNTVQDVNEIDLGAYPAGMYFLAVEMEDGTLINQKLLKQ